MPTRLSAVAATQLAGSDDGAGENVAGRAGQTDRQQLGAAMGHDPAPQRAVFAVQHHPAGHRAQMNAIEDQQHTGADAGGEAEAESEQRDLDIVRNDQRGNHRAHQTRNAVQIIRRGRVEIDEIRRRAGRRPRTDRVRWRQSSPAAEPKNIRADRATAPPCRRTARAKPAKP